MKKLISMLMLLALFCLPALSEEKPETANPFVFSRNGITWETKYDEVMEIEASNAVAEPEPDNRFPKYRIISVADTAPVRIYPVDLNYIFFNNRLISIFYDFRDFRDVSGAYQTLLAAMEYKYGLPMTDEENWATQALETVPESMLQQLDLKITETYTWQIADHTVAVLATFYRSTGSSDVPKGYERPFFALAYINQEFPPDIGFGVIKEVNTDGI